MTDTTTAPAPGTPTPAPASASPAAPAALAPTPPAAAAPAGDPPAASTSDPKPAAPVVPEKYDLKLPTDTLFDASALEGIGTFARDLGLDQANAQKLVERDSRLLGEFAQHIDATRKSAWDAQVAKWNAETQADPELGGDKFADTKFQADKALRAFATPEFLKALNESGFGNHPGLVRVFAKIGRTLSEDQFTTKGDPSPAVATDPAKIMFPSMN